MNFRHVLMSYEIGPGITIGYDIVWLRIRDKERSKLSLDVPDAIIHPCFVYLPVH